MAAFCDPSMATKMTVQFNLFGGTVLKLGTKVHHDALLKGMDTLADVGEPLTSPPTSLCGPESLPHPIVAS